MIVLKVLALGPEHGWGIAQQIERFSGEVFEVNQGSLYPALQRLKRKGWIRAEWQRSIKNRRARYYSLTRAGEKQLAHEMEEWKRAYGAVNRILRVALSEG
jgi:transcriptional regulator